MIATQQEDAIWNWIWPGDDDDIVAERSRQRVHAQTRVPAKDGGGQETVALSRPEAAGRRKKRGGGEALAQARVRIPSVHSLRLRNEARSKMDGKGSVNGGLM